MKKIKHSKYKNTGILFELLTRQVTVDTIENVKENISLNIIKKFFNKNSELYKEYKLYEILMTKKFSSESRAEKLIENVIKARGHINDKKLNEEKYNLVKEIKKHYPIKEFLNTSMNDYKIYSSISILFEASQLNEVNNIELKHNSEEALLEFMTKNNETQAETEKRLVSEEFIKESEEVRLYAYKLMVEKFNKKYQGLGSKQKRLLREYINNLSNTNNLRQYVNSEADSIKVMLENYLKKVNSEVTVIKMKEAVRLLENVKRGNVVKDNQLQSLMYYYEMLDEMEKLHG